MSVEVHLRSILYGAGIAVLLTLSSVNVYLLRTVKEANKTIQSTNQTIQATNALVNNLNQQTTLVTNKLNAKLDDAGRVLLVAGGVLGDARAVASVEKKAAEAQADSFAQVGAGMIKTVDDADHAINDLDVAIQVTSNDTQPVLASMQNAANGLSRDVNDPAVAETFSNLDHTSHDFVLMSDIALGDSQLADQRFRQLMKPMSIGERLMKTGLTTSVQILEGWFYGRADF
jgi:uncharacterized protein YoxC